MWAQRHQAKRSGLSGWYRIVSSCFVPLGATKSVAFKEPQGSERIGHGHDPWVLSRIISLHVQQSSQMCRLVVHSLRSVPSRKRSALTLQDHYPNFRVLAAEENIDNSSLEYRFRIETSLRYQECGIKRVCRNQESCPHSSSWSIAQVLRTIWATAAGNAPRELCWAIHVGPEASLRGTVFTY